MTCSIWRPSSAQYSVSSAWDLEWLTTHSAIYVSTRSVFGEAPIVLDVLLGKLRQSSAILDELSGVVDFRFGDSSQYLAPCCIGSG